MQSRRRWRIAIGPGYAILLVLGFLINAKVGVAVAVVGAMVTGLLWTLTSGPSGVPGEPGYVAGRNRNRNRNRNR
jgi:hypothetical protein